MQVATGTYTGNGSDDRAITGVGFQPDMVLVRLGDTGQYSSLRTSAMSAGDAIAIVGGTYTDGIQSLDADGFTIGTHARVNTSAATYHWLAVRDNGQSDFHVGTYTGNGSDDRAITGVGFQPRLVFILRSTGTGAYCSDQNSADSSFSITAAGLAANRIQSLDADGFTVGTDALVNSNTATYHYFAVSGSMLATGTYTGNATDDRSISGVGFSPAIVNVHRGATSFARYKLSTMGLNSANWPETTYATNIVQAMESDGFQIGTDATVNASTGNTTYYWWALKVGGAPVSVTPSTLATLLTSFAPTVTVASAGATVTPSSGALIAATFAPTTRLGTYPTPGVLANSLTSFAPTIVNPQGVTPGTLAALLSAFAPTVPVGQNVTPATASLVTALFAPTVINPMSATPGTLALSLAAFAPVASIGQYVTPDTLALLLASFAPLILLPNVVTPDLLALVLTAFEPTVPIGQFFTPDPAALVLASFEPTVAATANLFLTPEAASLVIVTFAPTLLIPVTWPRPKMGAGRFLGTPGAGNGRFVSVNHGAGRFFRLPPGSGR